MEFNLETFAITRHRQVARDARAARRSSTERARGPRGASGPPAPASAAPIAAPARDTVDAADLATWLRGDRPPQLVAVLSTWQFRTAHIAGSLHYESVEAGLRSLSRDEPVVVYCAGDPCPAARWAARLLRARGFRRVVVFPGGLQEWAATGGAVATAIGADTGSGAGRRLA